MAGAEHLAGFNLKHPQSMKPLEKAKQEVITSCSEQNHTHRGLANCTHRSIIGTLEKPGRQTAVQGAGITCWVKADSQGLMLIKTVKMHYPSAGGDTH